MRGMGTRTLLECLVTLLFGAFPLASAESRRPNILLIVSDDQGDPPTLVALIGSRFKRRISTVWPLAACA